MDREYTEIEKNIFTEFGINQIPKSITIDSKDNIVTISLNGKKVVEDNMQVTGNAFEGWAIVARVCSKKNVKLSVDGYISFPTDGFIGHGHYSRFIYRIMKFKEQYSWFEVDDCLQKEIENFQNFIKSNILVNNTPTKEAEGTDRIDENSVEKKLGEDGILRTVLGDNPNIGIGQVHRQLPVGLFCKEKSKHTSVFTYGHSAIDLWNKNGDTINVVELKYNNNMIGIITEIFFYSNYMLDLVGERGVFSLAEGEDCRGYSELKKGITSVNGIMLANKYHPCVNNGTLKVLNDNSNKSLKYYLAEYKADIIVNIN